jgi:hypothetical protein
MNEFYPKNSDIFGEYPFGSEAGLLGLPSPFGANWLTIRPGNLRMGNGS